MAAALARALRQVHPRALRANRRGPLATPSGWFASEVSPEEEGSEGAAGDEALRHSPPGAPLWSAREAAVKSVMKERVRPMLEEIYQRRKQKAYEKGGGAQYDWRRNHTW